jgi:quercetin dioxygenase-like cupin family protein
MLSLPTFSKANDAESLIWRGGETRVLIRGEQTRNAYTVLLVSIDGDQSRGVPAPSEAGYYLLKGSIKISSRFGSHLLEEGCFINIPRYIPHDVEIGPEGAMFLTFLSPAAESLWIDLEAADLENSEDGQPVARAPIFCPKGAGERIEKMGVEHLLKIDLPRSGDAYSLSEINIPTECTIPRYYLPDLEEGIFLLQGSLRFTIGDQVEEVVPGTWANIPRGISRSITNHGSIKAKALNFLGASPATPL